MIQLLTPTQRASLILSDVLGWSADEAAATLECVPTRANRQPAVAVYNHGEAMALDVIRIEDGMITEIITFGGSVFEEFGLPSKL